MIYLQEILFHDAVYKWGNVGLLHVCDKVSRCRVERVQASLAVT